VVIRVARDHRLRVAMIGTRGVPARYGGFETCIEEVGSRLVERDIDVVVYCRRIPGTTEPEQLTHRGMRLVQLPALRTRALETLSHTSLSVAHQLLHPADVALVFNAANAPLLPVLRARRIPVATHVDGLEWRRAKWGPTGRRYYRGAESLAVRWSDALIADATGIADYYVNEFGAAPDLISYGAPILADTPSDGLAGLDLEPGRYHLVVARFEPENHVEEIVAGYRRSGARLPLVVVGSAPYADEYTLRVRAAADERVRFLGGVWDQGLLDQLYAHCLTYLHGHSVGGTNPSLLRAIGAGAPSVAYDVPFNREVLRGAGRFFRTPDDVARAVERAEEDPAGERARGEEGREQAKRYDWDDVAGSYEVLCRRLAAAAPVRRPTGRRTRTIPAPASAHDADDAHSDDGARGDPVDGAANRASGGAANRASERAPDGAANRPADGPVNGAADGQARGSAQFERENQDRPTEVR
jgi:glycosyltransferase involved in cell wall biosynthesis